MSTVLILLQVSPVCVPEDPEATFERMLGVAAGWGVTESGGIADVLRQVFSYFS